MPEIIFEGDWGQQDVEAIAPILQKSLGMGDGIPEDLNPATIADPFTAKLNKRRKGLIDLWREAGRAIAPEPEEEDSRPNWDEYGLKKATYKSRTRIDADGDRFFLNENNRWQKLSEGGTLPQVSTGSFQFPITNGVFGEGVYFPVLAEPSGFIRLRLRLDVSPDQLITDEQFYAAEDDLSADTDLILDAQGVRAVALESGTSVTLLMVRSTDHIEPLGIIEGSGEVPKGTPQYRIVRLERFPNHLILDVEMAGENEPLSKSASTSSRSTLESSSHLNGTPLIRSGAPKLDRTLVKKAISRCRADGVPLDQVKISLVQGKPDFLPGMVRAFCLPSDGVINLCPHDPQGAIASLCDELATRLQSAVRAGAMSGDIALDILAKGARLDPEWWLEMLIKRYTGAILCEQRWSILQGGEPPREYMNLLAGRGVAHWGNRRTILGCMAEDFRVAYDPAGLPNFETLEWDLLVPGLARASQQLLLNLLGKEDETTKPS